MVAPTTWSCMTVPAQHPEHIYTSLADETWTSDRACSRAIQDMNAYSLGVVQRLLINKGRVSIHWRSIKSLGSTSQYAQDQGSFIQPDIHVLAYCLYGIWCLDQSCCCGT